MIHYIFTPMKILNRTRPEGDGPFNSFIGNGYPLNKLHLLTFQTPKGLASVSLGVAIYIWDFG